jgi:hypothetical protein
MVSCARVNCLSDVGIIYAAVKYLTLRCALIEDVHTPTGYVPVHVI